MKRVNEIQAYGFDSVEYMKIRQKTIDEKRRTLNYLLDKKIEKLESRLNGLKDTRLFLKTENPIYLIKDNDSRYGYIDAKGNNYEYRMIHDKPVLIDSKFNLYEIIEYEDMSDIGQKRGDMVSTVSWIDKVVRVEMISFCK